MRVLRVLPFMALGLLAGLPVQGQPAFLVKDINTTAPQHGAPASYLEIGALGSALFFTADDGTYGAEVWRSDGTSAGTSLFGDFCPGSCPSSPGSFTALNGFLYFLADDGVHGWRLWKSDGTPAGTTLLAPNVSMGSALVKAGDLMYFFGDDGVHGRELWKTDGTAAGTTLVKDINAGSGGVQGRVLAASGSRVLFTAGGFSGYGFLPWVTDGTEAGTSPVAASSVDLYGDKDAIAVPQGGFLFAADGGGGRGLWYTDGAPGSAVQIASAGSPHEMVSFQGAVYFAASDSAAGVELWKSDGTAAGTARLKDLLPGTTSSDPRELAVAGNRLYFHASDGVSGRELWKSDGTAAGTAPITDLNPGGNDAFPVVPPPDLSNLYHLSPLGTGLIFFAYDTTGLQLWKTDGVTTTKLSTAPVSYFPLLMDLDALVLGGRFYFLGGAAGSELWSSDGTVAGTQLVRDITGGTSSLVIYSGKLTEHAFAAQGSRLLFAATDGTSSQVQPWKTDGTAAGTSPFANLPSYIYGILPVGGRAVFPTSPSFWSSDGTAGGTVSLDGGNSPFGSFPSLGGSLFYVAYDSVSPFNQSLWKTDGTPGGTSRVGYLSTFLEGRSMVSFGGRIFVPGFENGSGYSLWVTDGTAPGAVHLSGLAHGHDLDSFDSLVAAGGTLFFTAYENGYGRELWKTDGTAAGTALLKNVPPPFNDSLSANGEAAAPAGGPLFFVAGDSTTGAELWKSDGTAAGTVLIADIRPGPQGSGPHSLTPIGNKLYFVADDGVHGNEVWVSDGTAAGTHLAVDLLPGGESSRPDSLAAVGNTLLFSAYDGAHGVEAWRTDGTALGTRMIQDIAPGPLSSSPTGFTAAGPNVYFAANDNTTGFELWAVPQDAVLGTFADVPPTYWAWRFIESLLRNGVTGGCGGGSFCPGAYINRAQMAVFVLTARGTPPPPATGTRFDDVPPGYWAGPWIEELASEGVVSGCSANPPLYCPDNLLTRAEMAVLLTLARHETPPPATGTRFADVPANYWAARFIEQLAADGVTSGCGGGNYCPDQPITRGEMAVFLATAFHLPLP
jgi:ELWxxDGT repeat protein